MSYYFDTTINGKSFNEVIELVTVELKKEGFGVLTTIDVKQTLKDKIDVDFKNYTILGACNPHFAHKVLSREDKIGVFLPCNVVVQELENGTIEVFAVDPIASMSPVKNESLGIIAVEVQQKLKNVIDNLE
ncbi:MAG: DUF302 domain-containing protein [Flavobacteriaceae bacterium]|nr:DUF302 domain-containing protein [Flavobacteriaceae bacterium]